MLSEGVVRVKSWREFKLLVNEQKPEFVAYVIEQNGFFPADELIALRLIIPSAKAHYVFLDFPKGDALRETGIPLRKDKQGNRLIEENDVKNFLKNQLGRYKLIICAY